MSKLKSLAVTLIVTILLGSVMYSAAMHSIRLYRVFISVFGIYGFLQSMYWLFKWLQVPTATYEELREDLYQTAPTEIRGPRWNNPFVEDVTREEDSDEPSDS